MKIKNIILSKILKKYPIENEIFVSEVSVNLILEQDKRTSAALFLSNFRFGYVTDISDGFYLESLDMLRYYRYHPDKDKSMLELIFINHKKPEDLNSDIILTFEVKKNNFDELQELLDKIYTAKFLLPSDYTSQKLYKSIELISKGKFENALEQLYRAKSLEPLCGTIDLMIVRTLDYSGKKEQATTYLAQNLDKFLYLAPQFLLSEFFDYEWHKGTLLYLPTLTDIEYSKDYSDTYKNLIRALYAKINKDLNNYIKYLSKLFLNIYESFFDEFDFSLFIFFMSNFYPFKSYLDIKEISSSILKSYNNYLLNLDEIDITDGVFIKEMLEFILSSSENIKYDQYIDFLYKFSFYDKNSSNYLLHKENFEKILLLNENVLNKSKLHDSFDLQSFLFSFQPWLDGSGIEKTEIQFAKIFANLRTGKKEPSKLYPELLNIKNSLYFKNLYNAWPVYFCEMEILLKQGNNSEKVFQSLYEAQKKARIYVDRGEPIIKYFDQIADFFQSWAFNAPSLMEESINSIPDEVSLKWLHILYNDAINTVKKEYKMISSSKQALEVIHNIMYGMSEIGSKKNIDSITKNKLETHRSNILNKLREKEIKIAVGGETSAGKTTFLNSLFKTNMFFVTQEEATGVPTEIRKSNILKIEVLDKNFIVKESLNSDISWFNLESNLIKEEYIDTVKSFISKYTRIGEASLSWVSKVRAFMPVENFPENLVLIDTPGFNAHESRSAIAQNVISNSHACIFLIDARNALKSKEMEILKSIRDEVGKTFLVLNKMDLVLGDDELDCDGSESADLIIERVKNDIKKYFNLEQAFIYPVCSLSKDERFPDANKYVDNLDSFRSQFISETMNQKLNLFLDSSAKEAVVISEIIFNIINKKIEEFQIEEIKIENSIPNDLSLYEEYIWEKISEHYNIYIEEYYKVLDEVITSQFNASVEYFEAWLNPITSQDILKKESQLKAQNLIQSIINNIDQVRKNELTKITKKLSNDLVNIFRNLYRQLPFNIDFDPNKISSSIEHLNQNKLVSLSHQINSVDYGKSTEFKGGLAFAAIGAAFAGPFGALLGGVVGRSLFGKPIGDIKQEIYNIFLENINPLYEKIISSCQSDFSEEKSNSFFEKLKNSINKQVENYRDEIWLKIKTEQNNFNKQRKELNDLQKNVITIRENAKLLELWRNEKKKQLDDQSTEQFIDEIRDSFGVSSESFESLLTIVVSSESLQYKTISDAIKKSSSGGRIIVKPGIYNETLEIDKEIEIIGEGDLSKIIIRSVNKPCLLINGCSAFIQGITFQGLSNEENYFTINVHNGNINIENCNISFESTKNISFNLSSCILISSNQENNFIKNCIISKSNGNGIILIENSNTLIENCKISNTLGKGLKLENSSKVIIESCDFLNNEIGIEITDSFENKIINSKFITNNKAIILNEKSENYFFNCLVSYSKIFGINTSGANKFEDLELKGNLNNQIFITNNANIILKNCCIHDSEGSGIYINNNSECRIEKSKIYNNSKEINVEDGSDINFLSLNEIKDNVIRFKKQSKFSKITSNLLKKFYFIKK